MPRMDAGGPGPSSSVLRSDTTKEIRDAAKAHLVRRMVQPWKRTWTPLASTAPACGPRRRSPPSSAWPRPSLGWFSELGGVDRHELVALLDESLDALVLRLSTERAATAPRPHSP